MEFEKIVPFYCTLIKHHVTNKILGGILNMNDFSNRKFKMIDIIFFVIFFISFIGLITTCFFYYNWLNQYWLIVLGWIILVLGFIPAILARFRFKKKGGVLEGESVLKTNTIVDSGIYRVVRNPMYLSPVLFTIGLVFISQHWISLCLSIPVIFYFYYYMLVEEKLNINKFGDEYTNYMKRTPRLNILYGFIKFLKDRRK